MSDESSTTAAREPDDKVKLYVTLQRLLALEAVDMPTVMQQAAQLLGDALWAEKFDVFQIDVGAATLVAMGTNDTLMGERQHELGLNRLPLAGGGREVEAFEQSGTYHTGHADQDPGMLPAIVNELGVRSVIIAPLTVAGERRGIMMATSSQPERFSQADFDFLQTTSNWVMLVMHRAEVVEKLLRQQKKDAPAIAEVDSEDYSGDLTDAQWQAVAQILPPPKQSGRPQTDLRTTLNGILYILRTHSAWRNLPRRYGSYTTCWRRYIRWQGDGTWPRIEDALAHAPSRVDA